MEHGFRDQCIFFASLKIFYVIEKGVEPSRIVKAFVLFLICVECRALCELHLRIFLDDR